ncbi:MAG: right-handed parallel beta-helix repeat-containing protein [Phycisphaerae bacterium]|nr:right-handed parallel beta-helix repeat-containing protein [Phycisphaerae bacterium]
MRRKCKTGIIVALLTSVAVAETPPPNAAFYVAPHGNDAWSGKLPAPSVDKTNGPFATLARARDAIRPLLPEMKTDLIVMLRGGAYYVEQTVVFGPEDSGRNGKKVVYTNFPGEQPRLIGGRAITGWQKHDDNVYRVKLDPAWKFHQLFAGGVRQTSARHPDEGYLRVAQGVKEHPKSQFVYKKGDLPEWKDWRGAQVYLWAGHDWFSNVLPIKQVDAKTCTISLAVPALQDVVKNEDRRYFVQGVREALDRAGEFWRDPETGDLFFWPGKLPIESLGVVAPTVTRILAVVGPKCETPVHDLVFRGLDLAISKFGDTFVETQGTHGQTPWNEPANKEAAVYLEHAERCAVEFCEISNAGYSGISLVWLGRQNRIYGNHLRDCGFHGVLLSGYRAEFGTKMDLNRDNEVSNNWIHHCGRLVGQGSGIFVWASGHNKLEHNLIHNSPRYGICVKGQRWGGEFPKAIGAEAINWDNHWDFLHSRENLIAHNDVHHVSEDSEDNGFISFWGVGKGNVVDHNLIHDSHRTLGGLGMAVYLDDAADYLTVTNNVIYGIEGGSVLRLIFAKGVQNRIENNVLIGGKRTTSGIASFFMAGERVDHHVYRRNIICLPNGAPVYEFMNWTANRVIESDDNVFNVPNGKVQMKGAPQGDTWERWKSQNGAKPFDAHSICGDPLFVDAAKHDYGLKPESPALKLGIKSIDTAGIGLRPDFPKRFGAEAITTRPSTRKTDER